MNQLSAMRLFVRIAEAGSLSEAARRYCCSLATVVRGLAALESHLGARLIHRTTRRMALTDAGAAYLERAREIIHLVSEAESAASIGGTQSRGVLTISAPLLFGRMHVAPVIDELLQQESALSAELRLSDRNVDLLDEGVDAAVRIGHLADSSLIAMEIGRVRKVICASPGYLARHGTPTAADDLERHHCLSLLSASGTRWGFSEGKTSSKARFASNTVDALIDAALRGQGLVSLLSYQVADALHEGSLVEVLGDLAPAPIPVSVVYPHARLQTAKVRRFRDAMIARKPWFDVASFGSTPR